MIVHPATGEQQTSLKIHVTPNAANDIVLRQCLTLHHMKGPVTKILIMIVKLEAGTVERGLR